jgi:hypothetical protein
VLAPLTKKGDRIRLLSEKWYGEYRDADGILRTEPLSTDKTAAAQMLAALIKKAELGRSGIADPYEQHRRQPLNEHLADWPAALRPAGWTSADRPPGCRSSPPSSATTSTNVGWSATHRASRLTDPALPRMS